MDSRTQERVEQWDSRPFSGGYDGLTDLSDEEFSGAVSAGSAWLFMLNGRIVGVVDGAIEDFENASGTIYEAPHPSLPLLSAMEEQGGDTRAKYYTNETPLREVDGTLQDGSFTGYIELSENVLSGDYYAVYYGGRRMAAAYIGSAERLVTGDDAFERADDEVGIYEVIDVDVDVTDVPGTEADAASGSGSSASASASASGTGGATATGDDRAETDATPSADPTESAVEPIDVSSSEPSVTIEDEDPTDGGGGVTAESTLESGAEASSRDDPSDPSGITTEYDETGGESAAAGSGAGITDASDASSAVNSDPDPDPSSSHAESSATERPTVADDEPIAAEPVPDADTETETEPDTDARTDTDPTASPDPAEVEAAAEQLDQNDISWTGDDASESEPDVSPGSETTGTRDAAEQMSTTSDAAAGTDTDAAPGTAADADADDSELEERFEEEEQWRETRRIPSIDPDNSESDESTQTRSAAGSASGSGAGSTADRRTGGARDTAATGSGRTADAHASNADAAGADQRASSSGRGSQSNADAGGAAAASSADHDQRVQQLSERIERLEEQREALEEKNKELAAEREQLREKNQELSETVDRLESRIDELETELQQARRADGAAASAGTQLSAERALAGTNLFVRYRSKSQPTLEMAHKGDADREEVATNLQLEHHTEFDADDVAVDGVPYEEFLTSSMAYRFVDWLTEMALYEIRDTGHASGLADLYDAIPQIDRAELDATISLEDDDTEDVPDQVTFDVVAFDKMGNPLVLVALNDSRQPITEDTLTELEANASAVKANYPDLAAAMAVTSSYFEPGALEVTEQATSGGLLSRGSKLSYVNLSRKQGYHLCLVESRSEGFHMNVPEL